MLCIKILRDSTVIGAEAHEFPVYVNYPYYSNIPLRCEEESAQGILSLDQSEIYHLVGKSSMPGDHLEAEEITEAEYEYLVEELDIPDEESATAAEPTTANTEADIPDEASATAAKPTFTVTDEATATTAAPSEEASNWLWLFILAGLAVLATAGETTRRVIKNKKNNSK